MGRWHFLDYSDVNLSLLARIGLCNRSLVGEMLFKLVSLLQRPITLPFVQITSLFFLCNISYNSFRTEPTSGRTICANLSINCQDANIPASSALTWIFFALTLFSYRINSCLYTSCTASLMGEAAWPCLPLFVVDVITAHAACRRLSRCRGR